MGAGTFRVNVNGQWAVEQDWEQAEREGRGRLLLCCHPAASD